jgi:hypothetical protein
VSGHLTAGPALGGGFRVQAQLPVEAPGGDHGPLDANETPAEARLP